MLNLISIIIGVVGLVLAVPALLPIVAWAFYLIIPLAVVGALIGVASQSNTGRNLNLLVIVIGVVRLMITGGLF